MEKEDKCKPTLNAFVNFEEWRRCDCVCQCTVLLVRGVTPMPDILLWYRVNKKKIVDDQSIYTVTLYVAETWKSSNPVSCLLSKRRHRSNRNDRIDLREKKDRGEAKEKVETGMIGDTSFLQCVGCKQIKVSELILLSRKFFLAQQCE